MNKLKDGLADDKELLELMRKLNTHDPHDMHNWEDETSLVSKVLFGVGFSISLLLLVYAWLIQ
jgi:hypothetical protein